jgi:hypothetical protein
LQNAYVATVGQGNMFPQQQDNDHISRTIYSVVKKIKNSKDKFTVMPQKIYIAEKQFRGKKEEVPHMILLHYLEWKPNGKRHQHH